MRKSKDEIIEVILAMHHKADWSGMIEAETLVECLGWQHPTEMPPEEWVRVRLRSALGMEPYKTT